MERNQKSIFHLQQTTNVQLVKLQKKKAKIIYMYWMLGHVRSAQAQVFPSAATYLVK